MILNAWFFTGVPDPVDQRVAGLLNRADPYIRSGASVIPSNLNCQTQALLALKVAEAKRVAQDTQPILWPFETGQLLTDDRFTVNSPEISKIIESASVAPVVVISALPLNKFNEWAQSSPLQSTEEVDDSFRFTILQKR